jgi:DNA polymerase III subunit beta
MKATLNKKQILPVLSKIQGLTGRKTNLAITTNVLIQTTDAGITLSATDLETGFEGVYSAAIESQGIIAINSRKLYEIVRDFPSDDIYIHEVENHWIEIGNEKVEYHIVGLNPDDFPEIPKIEGIEFFEMDSGALANMIEKTVIISGASDDTRAHIIGALAEHIQQEDQNLFRLVSTDGSRLSKVDYIFGHDVSPAGGINALIPKKGLMEVAKFLDAEGTVQVGIKDNNFIVKKDKETLIIRLLEGEFPQYQDIILMRDGNDIQMDRQLFLMMLKRMSILSSDEYKGVIFNFSENKLLINSTNPDIGESKESMDISYQGEPIEVMYNPKFFMETLSVIHEDNLVLNIIDEEKPCKIVGENDKTYLSVIMPMKI